MNASMCCCNCSTEVNDAPVSDWPCKMENQVSTWLSHDDRVGVKWKWTFGWLLQPTLVLLVSVEIVEDDVQLPIRKGNNDALHEAEELDSAAPLGMRGDDLPGAHLKSSKQGRGAVPLVIVALAAQGAPARKLQVALRPLQSLD